MSVDLARIEELAANWGGEAWFDKECLLDAGWSEWAAELIALCDPATIAALARGQAAP